MTEDTEIDPEQLKTELDHIKGAMGIQERYPGHLRLWLVYGALVPLAAAVSQYVVLADLPGYWHAVAWFGLMSLGGIYAWRQDEYEDYPGGTDAKPSVPLIFGAVLSYYVVLLAGLSQVSTTDSTEQALVFGLIVGLVGVSYLVLGNVLRAYYIRRLDRFALYVGGAWMLVLGGLIPVLEPLRTWGYAVFGVAFGLHSVASYLVLSRSR